MFIKVYWPFFAHHMIIKEQPQHPQEHRHRHRHRHRHQLRVIKILNDR